MQASLAYGTLRWIVLNLIFDVLLCLNYSFLLVAACLRVIVFDLDPILEFLTLYLLKSLRFDDVFEATSVTVGLQF